MVEPAPSAAAGPSERRRSAPRSRRRVEATPCHPPTAVGADFDPAATVSCVGARRAGVPRRSQPHG
ncbi:hypothetical protein CA982_16925 [Gordonia lacunae]|uniref:Uncharacterized protein n=1 Tax=Gordonia lacunae TaxID=417102 RepID=A0A243QA45_9ACTN|nr:hypothetical protein CA982_16925 [Gordonia lacunae]